MCAEAPLHQISGPVRTNCDRQEVSSSYYSWEEKDHISDDDGSDIISRITWDSEFQRSDFIIGFVDRFEGQLEINMDNWKKESTDEDFIPQHRILYIKHVNGEIVWDRRRRIDKIFTSGNSAFSELAFLM